MSIRPTLIARQELRKNLLCRKGNRPPHRYMRNKQTEDNESQGGREFRRSAGGNGQRILRESKPPKGMGEGPDLGLR